MKHVHKRCGCQRVTCKKGINYLVWICYNCLYDLEKRFKKAFN